MKKNPILNEKNYSDYSGSQQIIKINVISLYGFFNENSQRFDDEYIIKDKMLTCRISKILCLKSKDKNKITGLQIYYRNPEDNKIFQTINANALDPNSIEEEFILDYHEMITQFIVYKDDYLNGFQIKTNKNNEKIFGYPVGQKIEEFDSPKENYMIGFYCTFDKNYGVSGIGGYYLSQREYFLNFNWIYALFRLKLKNKEYKEKMEKKVKEMSYEEKAIFKLCCLPDNQYFGVFKYMFGS